uniref:Uncharacterized protein n=1 Tax=Arundo donax TaxID=35708 RepID=A0A0A9EMR6_ARUDO
MHDCLSICLQDRDFIGRNLSTLARSRPPASPSFHLSTSPLASSSPSRPRSATTRATAASSSARRSPPPIMSPMSSALSAARRSSAAWMPATWRQASA